jgi:hypothetical protein
MPPPAVLLRTLGLWLLYATVGTALLVMALSAGGDLGSGGGRSPTRLRSKALAAASGAVLAIAGLGWYLLHDPHALPTWPRRMVWFGVPVGVALAIGSWAWISADLTRGARRRTS